ncbi:MAG: hypothetical protein MZV64_00210 [Ignavibacteriales bacterium]|nr:hypothetical protein [Ignavibacteriales bacterium]
MLKRTVGRRSDRPGRYWRETTALRSLSERYFAEHPAGDHRQRERSCSCCGWTAVLFEDRPALVPCSWWPVRVS